MRFDKGFINPYFVTDQERQETVFEDPYILIANSKISNIKDLLPIVDKVIQDGKQAAHHRRGCRRRGSRDPRRQQDPRHLQVGRRQGPRLRRPPQGAAAGHRDPHGRPGDLRGGRPQARERDARPAWSCPQGGHHQGRDHHHRGFRRRRGHRRSRSPDPRGDREHRQATTTARSCRSAWPSWPAVSRSSRPAPRPRSSSRSASTASRMPCATRRPPSRRASSPVVASPSSRPARSRSTARPSRP